MYTTTGYGGNRVSLFCQKEFYLVHDYWARRRRDKFHLFEGILLSTRLLGTEVTG